MAVSGRWNRRGFLHAAAGLAASTAVAAYAQPGKAVGSRPLVVAQVVDSSPDQVDVSKDFLVGSKAAWQSINARGGLGGRQVQHLILEVDDSAASLRTALNTVKGSPGCVALFGTTGNRVASELLSLLRQDNYELAHVAPWLQNSELDGDGRTFPIFASQQEQIAQALKSLSALGVPEFGAIYASLQDYARYHKDVENAGQALRIRLKNFQPRADLTQIARELKADSPRILLFIGGTPELAQFLQGITQQDRQRYVIGLADVNLQIMTQMGIGRHTPVIATQVVPLVNSALPIVAQYRDSLARFYDEPPTPHSLAGYIAARYTREILGDVEGALTRQNVLQAFQLRRSVDLSGFRISFNASGRGGSYVTQSMMSADGRVVG